MGKGRRDRREEGAFTGRYEGPEVLGALLAQAGSPHEAEEVAEHFREAQAAGEPRGVPAGGLRLKCRLPSPT